MKVTRKDWIGWAVAGAALVGYGLVGFQSPNDKVATVDVVKVAEESNLGKSRQTLFAKQKAARETLIEFMDKNRVIAADQYPRLRELSVKVAPTDAETAELGKLKSDIQAKGKRLADLQVKQGSLTPEERQILDDYTRQSQQIESRINADFQFFASEMQQAYNTNREQVLDSARTTAKAVAKTQGFGLVFDSSAAPYGANDLTDATLQAINKNP